MRINAVCPTPDLSRLLLELVKCNSLDFEAEGDVFIRAAAASQEYSYKAFFSQLAVASLIGATISPVLDYMAGVHSETDRPDSRSEELIQAFTPLVKDAGVDPQVLRNLFESV